MINISCCRYFVDASCLLILPDQKFQMENKRGRNEKLVQSFYLHFADLNCEKISKANNGLVEKIQKEAGAHTRGKRFNGTSNTTD